MFRSLIRILCASLVQIDTEMADKYAKQQQPAVCGKFTFWRYASFKIERSTIEVTRPINAD